MRRRNVCFSIESREIVSIYAENFLSWAFSGTLAFSFDAALPILSNDSINLLLVLAFSQLDRNVERRVKTLSEST